MTVHQTRHHHSPVQVNDLRPWTDVRIDARVAADINDSPIQNGQRLLHAILGIDGIDVTIPINQIR
jgi:hypothetical protein